MLKVYVISCEVSRGTSFAVITIAPKTSGLPLTEAVIIALPAPTAVAVFPSMINLLVSFDVYSITADVSTVPSAL